MLNKSIFFKDKTSLVIRALISHPGQKWTLRTLAKTAKVSLGLTARTIGVLDHFNLLERNTSGRAGYNILKEPETLIEEWPRHYNFEKNKIFSYYSNAPISKIVEQLKLEKIKYAFTLHSAANLITNYFALKEYYLYVDVKNVNALAIKLSSKIEFTKLARGGNIHFVKPYYKSSIFLQNQTIKGFKLVSNLQLYLDLFHFYPRGNDHALFLKEILKNKLYE